MAAMTLFYPDLSSVQGGMSLDGATVVCCKATEGSGYVNPWYDATRREADRKGILFFGYHFLHAGAVEAQAGHCRSVVGTVPIMVDSEPEPEVGSYPSLGDLIGFIDAFRHLGGVCHLGYVPRWWWATPYTDGGMGRPSLALMAQRRVALISSDYLPYRDDGPGWEPYGGVTPQVWQYTDTAEWNGRLVDRNAFKGTLTQLQQLITTGTATPPAKAKEEDDDPMMLENGAGAETIITFTKGSRSWIAFGCDASRTRRHAPRLRVAVFSASRGWSQVEEVTMPVSGKAAVDFKAGDVAMLSVVRAAGDNGDDVPVGYNLG